MSVIAKNEALEKMAQAVGLAPPDVLVEIFAELFPRKQLPDVSGTKAKMVAEDLSRYIRAGLAPEEMTDLWRVVFPADRHVYYDEETDIIRYNEEEPWYAER